jgi:enamine deaminase RidA (YjgF/YER057c/UK114 family)
LRESADDARTHALSVQAEQFRGLEQRMTDHATESAQVVAAAVERLAERSAAVDVSLRTLRSDVLDAVERAASSIAAPSAEALVHARSEASKTATAAARAAELQSAHASRLDGAVAELHAEFATLAARSVDAAERQQAAVLALSGQIARSAAVQSESLETNFKGALEQALDKITRTMERATARPIEMNGEATDVLVARMFDVPEHELSSNLDQLDVEQRRSKSGTAKSVGRLKAMNGLAATNAE